MKKTQSKALRIASVTLVGGLVGYISTATISIEYLPLAFIAISLVIAVYAEYCNDETCASAKDITKSANFIPVLVHQLRAPLVGIRWGMAMLLNGEAGKLSPEQQKVAEESYRSVDKLMSYIRDILSLTNLDHYQYTFTAVDIKAVITTVLHELAREAMDKKIKLDFVSEHATIPQIQADPSKITIVLENLLENAIKYTIEGGKVSITIATEKEGLHIAITDSGMGIPQNDQDKIFTQFFRAKNAAITHPHGSGIGLYISKDIVLAHHGKIWFDTKENIGTTFHVILPFSLKETVK